MAYQPTCLVCQKVMELGFMTDFAGRVITVPRWCQGTPKDSYWRGEVLRSQAEHGIRIVAYRCPQCKALRLYAPDEAT